MKTLVFDLDGTLVNTIYDIGNSMNKSLLEHGFGEHPLDEYYNFIGEGVIILTKKAIGKEVSDEVMYSVLNRYNEIYSENSTILSQPYEGMMDVLDLLKQKGYRLAVISNKPNPDTKRIVKHYFLDRFEYVYGWCKEVKRKPDRMAMDLMLEKLELKMEDIVYIGDSRYDAQFAENCGCEYYLFEYGYEKKEILHSYNPKAFLSNSKDLLKYF